MQSTHDKLTAYIGHLVTAYRDDLEQHDKREIEQHPAGTPFIHVAYDSGTHMFMMPAAAADYWPGPGERVKYLFSSSTRERILESTGAGLEYLCTNLNRYQFTHFDGRRLATVTAIQALEIWQDYARRTARTWEGHGRPAAA